MSTEPRWTALLRAARGDQESLERCLESPSGPTRGLAAALALHCLDQGLEAPSAWQRALQRSAVHWLLIEEAADHCLAELCQAGVRAVAIKGFSLTGDYTPREQRPSADLDVLIPSSELETAQRVLREAGWSDLYLGARAAQYLEHEGYAWQASRPGCALLELHRQLWSSAPEQLASAVLSDAVPSESHSLRLRPSPAHRFLLAAVHGWQGKGNRRLLFLLDLEAIRAGACPDLAQQVVDAAHRHGLQLPVAMAARAAAQAFERAEYEVVASDLSRSLRSAERVVMRSTCPDRVDGRAISLARLAASRPSRLGVRALWRALWAHPGVVERDTPEGLPWWRRRLNWQLKRQRPLAGAS